MYCPLSFTITISKFKAMITENLFARIRLYTQLIKPTTKGCHCIALKVFLLTHMVKYRSRCIEHTVFSKCLNVFSLKQISKAIYMNNNNFLWFSSKCTFFVTETVDSSSLKSSGSDTVYPRQYKWIPDNLYSSLLQYF